MGFSKTNLKNFIWNLALGVENLTKNNGSLDYSEDDDDYDGGSWNFES